MNNHSIQLNSIHCNATSESNLTDGDEVYLVCQGDGGAAIRIPSERNSSQNMKKGSTWDLNQLTFLFQYEELVTIWDHDLNNDPNLATYLQSHDFEPGTGSGAIRLTNLNGADYTINYTYLG